MDYKSKIIKMVEEIEDEWVLEYLYHLIRIYLKGWGN